MIKLQNLSFETTRMRVLKALEPEASRLVDLTDPAIKGTCSRPETYVTSLPREVPIHQAAQTSVGDTLATLNLLEPLTGSIPGRPELLRRKISAEIAYHIDAF
jgi:hypothetical protein